MNALAVLILALLVALPAGAANRKSISHRHIPDAVSKMVPIGDLPSTNQIPLGIVLPLRNQDQMQAMLKDLYDPASPNYQHWLTPTQFTQLFGPTEADYEAAVNWAGTNGFTIEGRSKNRNVVALRANPTVIQRGFEVRMKKYRHPKESRDFYAPNQEPSSDCPVEISQVVGLDNYALPKPMIVPSGIPSPMTGSGPSGSYLGNDFRKAYIPTASQTGTGQSIALLQFDSYYPSDITNYCTLAGISPVPDVVIVPVLGGTCPGCSGGNGNLEVSLDIEMAIAMAPGIDHIYVYEAPLATAYWFYLFNQIATDNLAKNVSASWGMGELYGPNVTGPLAQMQLQGQTFFNSSGDYGGLDPVNGLSYPSQYTNVVSVGGTTLSTSSGAYLSESAWRYSTGGSSLTVPIPYWQTCAIKDYNYGSCTRRNNPDVAMVAASVYVSYGNGLTANNVGGTSVASPLWAGFMALVNQNRAANGKGSFGFLNPTLYAIGYGASYSANFYDTVSANTGSGTQYPATVKYDLATGWGSPKAALITTLLNSSTPSTCICTSGGVTAIIVSNSFTVTSESCSPTNNAVDPGETVTVSFGLKNIGMAPTASLVATLIAAGGVTPISISTNYGVLATNGTPVAKPFSFTANGVCGGLATATLSVQDGTNDLGDVSFSFALGALAYQTNILSQNFDGVTAPALPAGWTNWITSTTTKDTAPNAVFSDDTEIIVTNDLYSPRFALSSGQAQLWFRQNYFLESGYDGGVLEISVAGGDWMDILAAGGTFVSGGYIGTINTHYASPIAGRLAWTGNSGGFITTTVNMPPQALGQTNQLRWRFGSDLGISKPGWYVDTMSITNSVYVCCP